MNIIPLTIVYQGMLLRGHASPLVCFQNADPSSLTIYIQGWHLGTLNFINEKWIMDQPIDPKFIEALGTYISTYMLSIKQAMNYD
jgi:hypothetical protein